MCTVPGARVWPSTVSAQLAAFGFEIDLVASGAAALERLHLASAQHPYDVVLIDYQMPEMDGAALGERIARDPLLPKPHLVLLTSLDRKGDQARFAALGFAAYLTRPIRAREMRECLQQVLAIEETGSPSRKPSLVTRGTLANASTRRQYAGRVLVVEDNPVNQKMARKFLERLGCSVTVADDGSMALEICARTRFDLILMDMQMPVMDGLSATRELRRRQGDGVRTPIVALTANVMAGQFQACIDAGMDDALAKPIEPARLQDILERHLPGSAGRAAGPAQRARGGETARTGESR